MKVSLESTFNRENEIDNSNYVFYVEHPLLSSISYRLSLAHIFEQQIPEAKINTFIPFHFFQLNLVEKIQAIDNPPEILLFSCISRTIHQLKWFLEYRFLWTCQFFSDSKSDKHPPIYQSWLPHLCISYRISVIFVIYRV